MKVFKKKLFIWVTLLQKEGAGEDRGRETEWVNAPSAGSLSQWLQWPGLGVAETRSLGVFHMDDRGPRSPAIPCCFLEHIGMKLK